MSRDAIWSIVFSGAIAVLMLSILLTRAEPTPLWVLLAYPAVGAALGQVVSRTSPTVDGIARVETSTIAAAGIVILAILVNMLLIERLSSTVLAGGAGSIFTYIALPAISVLLWWALERRLGRMRRTQQTAETSSEGARPRRLTSAGPGAAREIQVSPSGRPENRSNAGSSTRTALPDPASDPPTAGRSRSV